MQGSIGRFQAETVAWDKANDSHRRTGQAERYKEQGNLQ